ncbi:hypothetical protein VP01_1957g1 [Puccinia sorghi]|uniref:Uncharacterized protein n=1 Tax=Puccinia sorghi TaxID=27349 RepID=A0A0L6VCJ5_9BASI|nr:hypothetical protein VP01_1957g1 [Puccinia sorghi]
MSWYPCDPIYNSPKPRTHEYPTGNQYVWAFGHLALTTTLEAEWELCSTFVNVVTPMLLFKLYTHCGYSVPENTAQI